MASKVIKPDYTSLDNIVKLVEAKKLLLPEFQRPFVWTIEQTRDLFDSMVRGIFIGAFMLAKPQFELSCREIETRPRSGKGSRGKVEPLCYQKEHFELEKTDVVLDGQQRITAIYRVLKGIDKLYFVFKNCDGLNYPTDLTSIDQVVDSISFKKETDSFCIELHEVYKIRHWKDKEIEKKIFENASEEYKHLFISEDIKSSYFDRLLDLKRLFNQLIEDQTQISLFFIDMDIEKFCMFFERSNSKGTELNFIHILTAKIYKDFNLDQNMKDFKEKNPNIYFDDSIVEAFVRYLAYIKVGEVDRKAILKSLDGNDFKKYWGEICEMYVKSCSFLTTQRLIWNIDWITYKSMFIPMIHFVMNIPNKDFSQISSEQSQLLKFWFWASLINIRYGGGMVGSTNQIIKEDCELLKRIAENKGYDPLILRKHKFDYDFDSLLSASSSGGFFVGIMAMMNHHHQFKNLGNNHFNDFRTANIHHIFPENYLKTAYGDQSYEYENCDTILNKMIIEKIPNIKFRDYAPSTYLAFDPLNKNPELAGSLSSHLIPDTNGFISGKYDNDFRKFISLRYEKISELIQKELAYVRDEMLKKYDTK